MAAQGQDHAAARALFERQLACVVDDDREVQLGLYAEDLHYEFPFATDRPRRIEGLAAFREVMEPIWERRRSNGVRLTVEGSEFHATDETGLYLAVFTLTAFVGTECMESAPCVQLLRVRDGRIAEVREYFAP